MRNQNGFSLIELIVTVVVMSILLASAMSYLRFDHGEDILKQKSESFTFFYHAAADEALLTGKVVRVSVKENDTDTRLVAQSKAQQGSEWIDVNDGLDDLILEKPLELSLSSTPTVFPSGQSSTFSVTFSLKGRENIVLNVDGMGRITRNRESE